MFRFPLAYRKITPMAVEFPVDPAGVVSGNIGPVIGGIIGTPVMDLRPAVPPSRRDTERKGLRRSRAHQEPGVCILGQRLGQRNRELEKTQDIADSNGLVIAVIGPP